MSFSPGFAIKAILLVTFCRMMAWRSVQNDDEVFHKFTVGSIVNVQTNC